MTEPIRDDRASNEDPAEGAVNPGEADQERKHAQEPSEGPDDEADQ